MNTGQHVGAAALVATWDVAAPPAMTFTKTPELLKLLHFPNQRNGKTLTDTNYIEGTVSFTTSKSWEDGLDIGALHFKLRS